MMEVHTLVHTKMHTNGWSPQTRRKNPKGNVLLELTTALSAQPRVLFTAGHTYVSEEMLSPFTPIYVLSTTQKH